MSFIGNVIASALSSARRQTSNSGHLADNESRALYIELMKRCLMNYIYDDDLDLMRGRNTLNPETGRIKFVSADPANPNRKYNGNIWPSKAHTMIGMPRLNDLHECIVDVLTKNVDGDLIETGVWRGGATIFMRAVLKAYNVTDRIVWVADSFEGLPKADENKHPYDSKLNLHLAEDLAVSLEEVQRNFAKYDLLDEQVRFLKGWFSDTLPNAPIERLAILRLDGDHYESTMDALVNLYPKLSVGGYLIIDDYNLIQGCNRAIHAYREQNNITDEIHELPECGAHWQRTST